MRSVLLVGLIVLMAGCTGESGPATDETGDDPGLKASEPEPELPATLDSEEGVAEITRYIAVVGAPGCDGMRIQAEAPGSMEHCGSRAPAPYTLEATGEILGYPAGSDLELDIWGTSDIPNPTTIKIRIYLNDTLIAEDSWEYLASGGGGANVGPHDSHDRFQQTYALGAAAEGKIRIEFERTQGESFWVTSGGAYTSSIKLGTQ